MKWLYGLVVAILLVSGCARKEPPLSPGTPASVSPAASADPGRVVAGKIKPGRGVEEVALGESRQDVEKRLGEPAERDSNPFQAENTFGLYYGQGIEISYLGDKVSMIVLHAAGDEWSAYPGGTDEGLWVGSTADEIRGRLGEPPQQLERGLKYPAQGLWFRLAEDGSVESLSLIPPQ
ncbi:MAG: hypothetical protein HY319_00520 [Armatimonadetes bacterium]|nr:hypothetical protein [Armatimonadota bacterium]